ncbi:SCO1860 family LAETG-anchored protein [Kitasatospora sp. NPDC004240]
MPSHRTTSSRIVSSAAAVVVCSLLTASPAVATGPAPAPAGRAAAVTAELDLEVGLANRAVVVPVKVSLNRVETPQQRVGAPPGPQAGGGSILTATVDGVDQKGPVTLVKADLGRSETRADANGTGASVRLVNADVHAPGLPATTLLGLEALSAEATCPVDGQPTANVTAPARVSVLGQPVTVGLYSPTTVEVPLIGSVSVEFSRRTTTSTTAAASALEVKVEVNPLNLNVARVSGRITVASVSCEKPGGPAPATTPATSTPAATTPAAVRPAVDQGTRAARPAPRAGAEEGGHLAATGGGATVPLAAGAGALLLAGAAALLATRRRRAAHARKH